MNYHDDMQKRIKAAGSLLFDPSISSSKLGALRALIAGINPTVERALEELEQQWATFEKLYGGDLVLLGAENLSEETEEEKKRKRFVLLLIKSWRQLTSEVERVGKELNTGDNSSRSTRSRWGKVFRVGTGTIGVATVAAVGIVLALRVAAATVVINNHNCSPIPLAPVAGLSFSLPGLSLPKEAIPTDGYAIAKIIPLTVEIDGTNGTTFTLKALGFSAVYPMPSGIQDITYNGASLIGTKTQIRLSEKGDHTVNLVCK